MTVIDERLNLLDQLHLKRGAHGSFDDGVCKRMCEVGR